MTPVTQDEKTIQSTTATNDASAAHIDALTGKHFKSRGYHVHNEFTYRGIDWLANSAVGVTATFATARTELGKKVFQKPATDFFEFILKPVLKDPKALKEGAGWGAAFLSIMAGGFAIIPVMMFMENKKHKKSIVRWLDEKIYGQESVAKDPRFEESYDRIDKEPSKGFWTGMAARIIAVTPLIAMAVTPKINNKLIEHIYDPIGRVTQRVFEVLGKKNYKTPAVLLNGEIPLPEGQLKNKVGHLAKTDSLSNGDFLHRTIGFDFGLTVLYAIMHEIAYKALSARNQRKEEAKTESLAAANAVSVDTASLPHATKILTSNKLDNSTSWTDKNPKTKQRLEKPADYTVSVNQSRASLSSQLAH